MSSFLQSDARFVAIGSTLLRDHPEMDPKAVRKIMQAMQRLNATTVALQYGDPRPVYRTLPELDPKGKALGSDAAMFKALEGLDYQIEAHRIKSGTTLRDGTKVPGRKFTAGERLALGQLEYWIGVYARKVARKYMDMDVHAARAWAI